MESASIVAVAFSKGDMTFPSFFVSSARSLRVQYGTGMFFATLWVGFGMLPCFSIVYTDILASHLFCIALFVAEFDCLAVQMRIGIFGCFLSSSLWRNYAFRIDKAFLRTCIKMIGCPVLWFLGRHLDGNHLVVLNAHPCLVCFVNLLGSGVLTQCPMPEVVWYDWR